jgi:parallel beta-helix repeat protein
MEGCVNSTVIDCSYRHNTNGVYVSDCKGISIIGSLFFKNTYGVFLSRTFNSSVSSSFFESNEYGIYLDSSDRNELAGNHILNCSRRSLTLDSFLDRGSPSSHNTIFSNFFSGETLFTHHAMDNGENNAWDNGSEGNHWPDHDGPDADGDGIVDAGYVISGSSGAVDRFPIAPVIASLLDDGEVEGGSVGGYGLWLIMGLAAFVTLLLVMVAVVQKPRK